MGVIWHGSYLRYFEDGREAFGREYGLTYLKFYDNGFFVPIVKSQVEHKAVVQYGQEIEIIAKLTPTAAAKLVFDYEVHNLTTRRLAATGKTVQVFMHAETRELHLTQPKFYEDWLIEQGLK